MTTDDTTRHTNEPGFGPAPSRPNDGALLEAWDDNPTPDGDDFELKSFTGWYDQNGRFVAGASDNKHQWLACSASVELKGWR